MRYKWAQEWVEMWRWGLFPRTIHEHADSGFHSHFEVENGASI